MAPRVLIAEDDAGLRRLLTKAFEYSGFVVMAVENGTKALEVLETTVPEVLILDVNMPEVSGLQVVRKARRSLRGQQANIILMTGDEQAQYSPEAALTDFFLFKPVGMTELVTLAQRLFASSGRAVK